MKIMRRLVISLILGLGLATGGFAQSFTLSYAKEMPSFDGGGITAFTRKVQEVLVYPAGTADRREGNVTVGFFISKEGKLLMSKVLKGMDDAFDEEALKAVRSVGGAWTPALDETGAPMDWYVTVQVAFTPPKEDIL